MKKKVRWSLFFLLFFVVIIKEDQAFSVEVDTGKGLYEVHCAGCHGISGDGKGPAAASLNPKPTDFTNAQIMSKITYVDMERAVFLGKTNTAMDGFANLMTSGDVREVIVYVKKFLP